MNTKKTTTKKSLKAAALFLLLPFVSLAQENTAASSSYFSNALFNTLLVTIILLAIIVMALSNVLKNLSNSDALLNLIKGKDKNQTPPSVKSSAIFIFLMFAGSSLFAQGSAAADDGRIGGLDGFTFYTMTIVIFLELIVVAVLIYTLKFLLKTSVPDSVKAKMAEEPAIVETILKKLSGAVDIDKEESILLDHDYDGIKELDNDLPPWWKYGFYLTIVVAVVYLINYHVTKTAPLQAEEYHLAMKKAEADIAEFMKTSANNVDENTVKMLDSPSDLAAGKDIFISTCAACHGKFGEGTVGPNLTDDYWIHSGSVREIFKTIKYGWPDKGMKSWKEDFSPIQIAQLTSYIRTLRGTNPPKPKDKQGDLYVEEAVSDSTSTPSDSLQIKLAVDSLKK
ncbi:cbb3-type cytochrome c oxidase N-terminal domain-containing protein [Aurantibacillus circumpalustris]|uniref:cbb3-type cytochrome c oxidase N-terminal domain-containing protein n=1 Tax=Aurantibacillus circumpalustris TaxID=3036359 RepID=UPI00295BBEDF|nr:cbb3-type cytochrome c oxidase N-terminal domain-containing protein [Aurantibacillus circumpalustris]